MDIPPIAGRAQALAPGLRRVLAPNPSPLTGSGTNTYILGEGQVAVIDPGPALAVHLDAILAALAPGESVSHILVTHAHLDHSPLARPLKARTGAPVLAFGPALAGRSPLMERLAATGDLGGGEGVDAGFLPDARLADGDRVAGAGWAVTALHTPGHFGNHLCFLWGEAAFSGDHVMGWSSTLVSPPDGDMGAYMASLDRLKARITGPLYPGHGEPVADGPARIDALAAHRRDREAAIRAALRRGAETAEGLARRLYTDTPAALLPAASRNVFAHLLDLMERKIAAPEGPPGANTPFHLTAPPAPPAG